MKLVNSDILDRAVLETLEHRQMLSSVSFNGDVLGITGLASSSNTIKLKLMHGRVQTVLNGQVSSRSIQGMKSIAIVGGDQNDYIEVDSRISIPVKVIGGAGNDRISTGSGADQIDGGAGNDTIYAGAGGDVISGGADRDRVYGGKGNDTINGNAGHDLLYGEAHDDTFDKVERYDRVYGGGGRDKMNAAETDTTPTVSSSKGSHKGPHVERLSLINADTGKIVDGYAELKSGMVLDLSKLPKHLNIAAQLAGGSSGVRFDYDGDKGYRVENASPYALAGDNAGRYKVMTLTEGSHTLKAHTVGKQGVVLASNGITFTVVNKSTTTPKPGQQDGSDDGSSTPTDNGSDTPTDNGNGTPTDNGGTPTGNDDDNGTPVTPIDQGNQAGTPEAHIAAVSTTVPAGTSVHVDALVSKLNGGDWNTGQYLWNFGDAGTNYNELKGFNAAHTYDKAGKYTITLTVINSGGKSDSVSISVNVTPAARKVIYVSNDGNDSNSGASASSAIKSFAKAASLVSDNTEILFQRGDTFTMSAGMFISGNNVVIGAYGIGARPTLKWNGPRDGRAIFNTRPSATNVTVQDLSLDSIFNQDTNDTGTPLGFYPAGKNITVRRIEFLNLMYGANLNVRPDGFLMQENTAPLLTGLRKYFAWVEGSHISIIGNVVANSTREHIVRVNYVSKLLVMDNDFTNVSRRDQGDYWDYSGKTALNVQSGEFAFLADNKLHGPFQIGPLGKADGLRHPDFRFKYAIAEGNTLYNDTLGIQHGGEHITVRNNVFDVNGFSAINVDGYNSEYGRGVVDLVLQNNTGFNKDNKGRFIRFNGSVAGIRMVDNIYIAPNLAIGSNTSGAIKVDEASLKSFTEIDGNIWPVAGSVASWVGEQAMNYIGSGYDTGFQTASEWNNQKVVGTDTFSNIKLNGLTYTMVNGHQVGAKLAA